LDLIIIAKGFDSGMAQTILERTGNGKLAYQIARLVAIVVKNINVLKILFVRSLSKWLRSHPAQKPLFYII